MDLAPWIPPAILVRGANPRVGCDTIVRIAQPGTDATVVNVRCVGANIN